MWREGKPRAELSSSAGRSSGEWRMAGNLSRASFAATMESSTQTAAATSKKACWKGARANEGERYAWVIALLQRIHQHTHSQRRQQHFQREFVCKKRHRKLGESKHRKTGERAKAEGKQDTALHVCVWRECVWGERRQAVWGGGPSIATATLHASTILFFFAGICSYNA